MGDVFWEVYVFEGPCKPDGYGELLAVIPGQTTLSIAPLGNAVGAGSIQLPLASPVFHQGGFSPETTPVLAKETLWQCRQNGTAVFEFLAQSVDRTTVAPDETQTVTVSGPGTAQVLNWAMAMPAGWEPQDGGFTASTGAVQDPFSEQDPVTGAYKLDTVLWNLCTPGACQIVPGASYTFNPVYYPPGAGTGITGGRQTYFNGGGGAVNVQLSPGGGYLGGGPFTFVNSSFSASVTAPVPVTAGAPGTPLDNDAANGSDVTQLIVRPSSGTGYMMIALSYSALWCEYQDRNGKVTKFTVGKGRAGGTGAYDPSFAQFWRVSCDTVAGQPGHLYRFWTSGDGAAWTLQFSVAPGAAGWDPRMTDVFMGGYYNTTGKFGAYAQFSSLNGDIQAGADLGPVYISAPAMAVVLDLLDAAADRGTVPFVSPAWSAQSDSGGEAWTDAWSVQVPAGTDLLTVMQNYAGAVPASWYMNPGYVLTAQLAPGRRLENQVVFHAGEIVTYGRTQARDQLYNVAATADGAGTIWTRADQASAAKWGQRETWTSSGTAADAQTAVNVAQAAVDQWGTETDARVIQIPPNLDGKTVFQDIQVFDWIGIERSDFSQTDAVQVIGITVGVDQDGAETHELVITTYRQVLAQYFQYLMNKFGGQSASTLGALTPGTTASSPFTLATGPSQLITPFQTGGSGSSRSSALAGATSLFATPEVAAAQTGGPSGGFPGQIIASGSIPASAAGFSALEIGGITVFMQPNQPSGHGLAVNSLWYDTANGFLLNNWNGTAWVPQQFGTQAIAANSVTTSLLAAQAVTAAQIQAGTITADRLVSGIVVAGIVNATTITAATLNGATFNGTGWTENPQGEFFLSGSGIAVSIAPTPGSYHGTNYVSGVAAYGGTPPGGSNPATIQLASATFDPTLTLDTGAGGEQFSSQVVSHTVNAGSSGEYTQVIFKGPGSTSDGIQTTVTLSSNAKNGSSVASGQLTVANSTVLEWDVTGTRIGSLHVSYTYGNGQLVTDDHMIVGGFLTVNGGMINATQGVNAGGGSNAGYWVGPTQVITAGATFAVGVFNGVGITGAASIHTSGVGQFDGGVSTAGITASSIHTSGAGQFDGGVTTTSVGASALSTFSGGINAAGYAVGATQVILPNATFGTGVFNGVGITGAASIHTSGIGQFDGGVTTAGITASSIHTSGNAQVDGQISTSNMLIASGGVNAGGGPGAGFWIGSTQVILANATIGTGVFNGVGITGAASIHTSGVGQFDGGVTTTGITASSIHTSGIGQFDSGVVTTAVTSSAMSSFGGGINAGGGSGAGFWIGSTQVILANATFGIGQFNGVGITGASSIHTSGIGQFDGGVVTTSINASGALQVNGIYSHSGTGVGMYYNSTQYSAYWDSAGIHVTGSLYGTGGTLTIGDTLDCSAHGIKLPGTTGTNLNCTNWNNATLNLNNLYNAMIASGIMHNN